MDCDSIANMTTVVNQTDAITNSLSSHAAGPGSAGAFSHGHFITQESIDAAIVDGPFECEGGFQLDITVTWICLEWGGHATLSRQPCRDSVWPTSRTVHMASSNPNTGLAKIRQPLYDGGDTVIVTVDASEEIEPPSCPTWLIRNLNASNLTVNPLQQP